MASASVLPNSGLPDHELAGPGLAGPGPLGNGLYDSQNEHDACGVGFVADLTGQRRHDTVTSALTVLRNLDHRGAKGADPKWLVPLICRAGGLTKADIGTIRVFDQETKFQISAEAADKFTADIKRRIGETPRIEPLGPAGEGTSARVGGKPDKRTRQARKAQRDA